MREKRSHDKICIYQHDYTDEGKRVEYSRSKRHWDDDSGLDNAMRMKRVLLSAVNEKVALPTLEAGHYESSVNYKDSSRSFRVTK